LERSEHLAEWLRLTDGVSAQLAPKPKGGRPEGGVNAAARELNIDRTEAQRAIQIDGLSPDAKAAAIAAGIHDTQSTMLKVANPNDARASAMVRVRGNREPVKT
jgi:ParB family chromosome partitioning protein